MRKVLRELSTGTADMLQQIDRYLGTAELRIHFKKACDSVKMHLKPARIELRTQNTKHDHTDPSCHVKQIMSRATIGLSFVWSQAPPACGAGTPVGSYQLLQETLLRFHLVFTLHVTLKYSMT